MYILITIYSQIYYIIVGICSIYLKKHSPINLQIYNFFFIISFFFSKNAINLTVIGELTLLRKFFLK